MALATGASPLPRGDSYRWAVLGAAVMSQTTASIVAQGIYTLVPFFQAAFHLSQASAALAVSAVNAGQVASMLLMGWLIDKHGERGVVGCTAIVMGAAALCAATASRYAALLGFLFVLGIGYASVQPGGTRAILRWFAPAQRGMATGIRQAGLPLGTALAAMLLPLLASAYGWQRALLVQGAIGIAGGLLFVLVYRGAGSGEPRAAPPPSPLRLIRAIRSDKALWPVMLAGLAMVTFQYTFATHVLTFLASRFGMPLVAAGLLYAVSQWLGIAGRIGLAWISDHLWPGRRMRSLTAVMFACAAALLALLAMPGDTPLWMLVAIFGVVGIFGVGWYPLYLLEVAEMAPKTAVASTIGFSMTLNMVSISIAPPLFGFVVDHAGYTPAWLSLAALVALAALHLGMRSGRAGAPVAG
ncbi:MFS transporter [Ramlibacter sp.]|uniref:MFS transporter n=1 Tax=Ramlibacter sp. TaxID=1917967 RepID=UPI0018379027|nr:MFS transporter [Ramlibacter sp.]MBA2672692.1 MFS transporter [Ramlibacter sp.]